MFEIHQVQHPNDSSKQRVILLDSQTGRTWLWIMNPPDADRGNWAAINPDTDSNRAKAAVPATK